MIKRHEVQGTTIDLDGNDTLKPKETNNTFDNFNLISLGSSGIFILIS